jgi:hypothetical protein
MLTGLKKFIVLGVFALTATQLNGCATTIAGVEGLAESMNPTVMAALDSFESAAMSIKLSNRVLQDIPISELDVWPLKLQGAISGSGVAKMGLSLLGSSQGVTIPTEMDPETGFPRPTSALYIYLKERDKMLSGLKKKDDIAWFKNQPLTVIQRDFPNRKLNDGSEVPPLYRNTLMAYGVVTANNEALLEMQQDVDNTAKGFRTCNAFIHKSTEEVKDAKIIKASCPDPALKDEDIVKKLTTKVSDKKEEMAEAEKKYGKLAGRIYKGAISGADFSAAAVTKITAAIINGVRALPNIKSEFSGLRGAYNIVVIIPRAKNVFKSMGVYKDNLGFQWTVYKTMYQQIKGTYEIKDDEPTKEALQRIKAVELAMAELEPKLNLAIAGEPVQFSDAEVGRLNMLAAMFPTCQELEQTLLAAWRE